MPQVVPVPKFISENAARGLKYREEGKGGDGLVEQTIRDARDMVEGSISEAKLRKMGPWFERHQVDMSAPANDPDSSDFPGAGAVAWLLWGGSVSGDKMDAAKWAQREVERLERESAFYSGPKFMEHTTIEETLAAVQASLAEAVATRDEVAAKAVEASESSKAAIAERDAKVAELTLALEAATKANAELTAKVASLESETITASEQAAVIAASVGVDPVETVTPEQADNSPEAIRQKFLSMPVGRARQVFFNANRKVILGSR